MIEALPNARPASGWHLLEGICPLSTPGGANGVLRQLDLRGHVHESPLGIVGPGVPVSAVVVVFEGVVEWSLVATLATADCSVARDGFLLRPIGRPEALQRLLRALAFPGGKLAPGRLPALVARLGALLCAGRLRLMGERLLLMYQFDLGRASGVQSMPACVVRSVASWPFTGRWQPLHQLEHVGGNAEEVEWEATGDDPQFLLVRRGQPTRLPAGWYELDLQIIVRAGRLLAPTLYLDFGSGWSAHEAMPLAPADVDGRSRTLLMFRSDVMRVRLDPSMRPMRFSVGPGQLRRIGRLRALLRLLGSAATVNGSRDWMAAAQSARRFAVHAMRDGLSAAASRLHGRDRNGGAGAEADYTDWVRMYDTQNAADRRMLEQRASRLSAGPLISILLPTYQTPEQWLRRCLDSVLAQAYGNWELCAVDDASPSPHVLRILEDYARKDVRIRVFRRPENGHISAASNIALAMARGAFIALLDHDDELRPHALLEMAEAIARKPDVGLLYSDEDKIDGEGQRFHPYFKPAWNPDLLLSQNYLCHLAVIRTQLAREVGGFRVGFEGSQDHDLFLRCTAGLEPGQVHHVPKVLYHWRAIAGSTALERGAKDYAASAGARAVQAHLSLTSPGATVEQLPQGHYRVRWPLPEPAPAVCIVIPTRDRVDLLRTCIESLLDLTDYPRYEVVVVDNQSRDPDALEYLDSLATRTRIRVLTYDEPFNYSAINNWAVAQCEGEIVCLLNNDIEVVDGGWLREMVGQAVRPGVGAVGAMLYYPDRTIQHAGVVLGLGGVANHVYTGQPAGYPGHGARAMVAQGLSAVTGACLVVRRQLYEQVGGLDERLAVAFNDIDFCLRLCESGFRNVWTPFAELIHHESASRGRDESPEKRERFLGEVRYMESRWDDWLQDDPAYNRNLSLSDLSSGLAFPPR